jgi:signal peptidase I
MARRSILKEIFSWLMAIIIPVLLVFALNLFVFAISGVRQESMENTLKEGDVVFFSRLSSNIEKLKR